MSGKKTHFSSWKKLGRERRKCPRSENLLYIQRILLQKRCNCEWICKKKTVLSNWTKECLKKKIISPLGKIRKGKEKCPHSVGNIPKSENICKYKHFVGLARFKILSWMRKFEIINKSIKIMSLFLFVYSMYLGPIRRELTFSTNHCLVSIWSPCGYND